MAAVSLSLVVLLPLFITEGINSPSVPEIVVTSARSPSNKSQIEQPSYGANPVRAAVLRTLTSSCDGPAMRQNCCSVPMFLVPTFHDGDLLPKMLLSLDSNNVRVDRFLFVWNSEDERIGMLLRDLADHSNGRVNYIHRPENIGFAASVNAGLREAEKLEEGGSSKVPWVFVSNADVEFVDNSLGKFSRYMCDKLPKARSNLRAITTHKKIGTAYFGSKREHYAFAVTKEAVDEAGTMDENFFPAYYEDIDWRWRMHLLGFEDAVADVAPPPKHVGSVNLKRGGNPNIRMLQRSGYGAHYFEAKWGGPIVVDRKSNLPTNAHRRPFGLSRFPIDAWVADKTRLLCIRHGGAGYPRHGGYSANEGSVCWYNGSVLIPLLLKANSTDLLPPPLRHPTSRGYLTTSLRD